MCTLNVLGQGKPSTQKRTTPATTTPRSQTAVSQESDLERELNQKSSVPNRLGPSPSKKNSVPSNTVQSTSSDTTQSRPVVASSDSIRFDSLKAIRFQVSKLTPSRYSAG
ncbi:hypothetical protein [Spirosoma foliorum]|uniref:Uncharacterized protein n=1 Tax=Spirosoma foliorum TaxID=2710596 RepID=A0A7G5GSH3_9BACT|nr:hypothetical protein [Spirosoma foliorum]QMW01815.1 hypothetical protein H3H32_28305 [Spirosoma foliorum]